MLCKQLINRNVDMLTNASSLVLSKLVAFLATSAFKAALRLQARLRAGIRILCTFFNICKHVIPYFITLSQKLKQKQHKTNITLTPF